MRLPRHVLATLVLLLCLVGAYSLNNSQLDLWGRVGFGIFGYGLRKLAIDPSPLVVALVLGPLMQETLRQSLFMARSDFLVGNEARLVCTWPHRGRPRYPFPYVDECWTGAEYAVAGLLLYEGEVEAGLEIVRAVRARHDGVRRNPWDEFECGHHYARALSSWALLLALSGYHYNAPAGHLRFALRVPADGFRAFFTAGAAWGTVEIGAAGATLTVHEGAVALRALEIGDRAYAFEPPTMIRPRPAAAGVALTPTVPRW